MKQKAKSPLTLKKDGSTILKENSLTKIAKSLSETMCDPTCGQKISCFKNLFKRTKQ